MSDQQKAIEMPSKNNAKKEKAKKTNKKSIGWIIGVVILILISVTFVIPATAFSGNSTSSGVKFGSYDGENIELSYNSFFYYQLQNYYNYYVQQVGEEAAANYIYNIYYSAYQASLINERFQKLAAEAGIKATASQVSDAVINSGYYSDGTNVYSAEVYAKAEDSTKEQIVAWMKEAVPASQVESLINSAKVSSAEKEFLGTINASPRAFEYLTVSGILYPDEAAEAYAAEHPELFQTIDLRRATFATEEEAAEALTKIAAGTQTMDDAVAVSIDSSASDEGKLEGLYRFLLDSYLSSTSADSSAEIFAAEKGSLVGPVYTSEGYTLFYVTEAAKAFDVKAEDALTAVKSYMTQYESETVLASLQTIADEVYATAKAEGMEKAAEKYGLTVSTISSVSENPGDTQYIVSLNYNDVTYDANYNTQSGYVYTAATADKTYSDKLFNTAIGTVLEPVVSSNAYIIAMPTEGTTEDNSFMVELMQTYYSSYAPQHTLQDLQNATLNSDKVEDNFVAGFLQAVYGM